MQNLARANDHLLRAVRTQPELERTVQDEGELFVLVLVAGHHAAFPQQHVRQHDPVPRDQATFELLVQLLPGKVLPARKGHRGLCHRSAPFGV
jgi:hypothetical protein